MLYSNYPYFRGYELEQCIVNEKEYDMLDACYWMVSYKYTIREAALKSGIPKSTLHYKIHHELRYLSPDLYNAVKKQMKENMKRWGGNHK